MKIEIFNFLEKEQLLILKYLNLGDTH